MKMENGFWFLEHENVYDKENVTAEQVYVDMLHKIVEAPARLYMRAVVRMLIPVIGRKLKERGL